jgi:hypothetical protein
MCGRWMWCSQYSWCKATCIFLLLAINFFQRNLTRFQFKFSNCS